MTNKDYIVISNGLFKDSFTEEAVVNKELRQRVISKSRRTGYSHSLNEIMSALYTGEAGLQAFDEAVHREIERQRNFSSTLTGTAITFGTAGESQLENEQLWTDIRNETQTPEVDLSVMTEEEIINHFDTISNEQQ